MNVTIAATPQDVTVDTSARDYWDPVTELMDQIDAAIQSHGAAPTVSITLTDSARTASISSSQAFSIDWSSSTLPAYVLGYNQTDTTTSTTLLVTPAVGGYWLPGRLPSQDTRSRQRVNAAARTTLLGDVKSTYFGLRQAERRVMFMRLPNDVAVKEYNALPWYTFEFAWQESLGRGGEFELFEEESATTSIGTFKLKMPGVDPITQNSSYQYRWDVQFEMVES